MESELEKKLKTILDKVSTRLSQKEIPSKEYHQLVFNQLRSEGFIQGDSFEEMKAAGYFLVELEKKLGIERRVGLNREYYISKTAPFSPEAQEDIQKLKKLGDSARDYLKEKASQGAISQEEFKQLLKDYISDKASLDKYRTAEITGWLMATLEKEVTLKKETPKIGEYPLPVIKEIMGRL